MRADDREAGGLGGPFSAQSKGKKRRAVAGDKVFAGGRELPAVFFLEFGVPGREELRAEGGDRVERRGGLAAPSTLVNSMLKNSMDVIRSD